nr:hypothetical protein [Microbispora sp. GKU 823]
MPMIDQAQVIARPARTNGARICRGTPGGATRNPERDSCDTVSGTAVMPRSRTTTSTASTTNGVTSGPGANCRSTAPSRPPAPTPRALATTL